MKTALRIFIGLVLAVILGASGLAGWMTWRFMATKPQVEGLAKVEGLEGGALIIRDPHGIPHIFSETGDDHDVMFALGYAHAQDRFFQMDLIRRFVEGRLSEVIGSAALASDARVRTLGYPQIAIAAADALTPENRTLVEAYAAGVNARLNKGAPSPEYAMLWFSPEPWDVADSTSVIVYMTDQLIVGGEEEFERAYLADVLTQTQLDQFVGPYPEDGPVTLDAADLGALANGAPSGDSTTRTSPEPGSNAWVARGSRTEGGAPLLASDPHLGLGAPSVWYFARLALSSGNVVGASVPGAPMIVLGRNDSIAWGFTNTGFDVEDYVVVADDALDAETREETITVRGLPGFARRETINVRTTAAGSVLDPEWFPEAEAWGEGVHVVLRTTADDQPVGAANSAMSLMTATNWETFVAAGQGWTAPMQNMHFASVDGDIGYTTPGHLPRRDASGAWIDLIAYDELPRVLNPASDLIYSANNRVAPDAYRYPTPGRYALWRGVRLERVIEETVRHTVDSFVAMHLDVTSEQARALRPAIVNANPQTEAGRNLQDLLTDWLEPVMDKDRPEPLGYAAFTAALPQVVYADELGEDFETFHSNRRVFITNVFTDSAHAPWCDDVTTLEVVETCRDAASAALDLAGGKLVDQFGSEMEQWRWGDAHKAVFDHPLSPVFSGLPLLGGRLDSLFNVRVPVGGDSTTLNVAHFPFSALETGAYDAVHGPSMRAIYDLSDLNASLFMHAPGQSGHPLSPHYRDLADDWADGEYVEIRADWGADAPPDGYRVLELRNE